MQPPAATLPGQRGTASLRGDLCRLCPGFRAYNNMSVFSLGGFLKRKKNFHFDFTLRYHCFWVRALPLSPGWSLGLFSSVSRWGCVPKGHRPRFTPPLPTSSRDCTGQGLPLPQHASGFYGAENLQLAVGQWAVLSVSVPRFGLRSG